MKKEERTGFRKFLNGTKMVLYFLLLLGMKAFKKAPKETAQVTASNARKKHTSFLSQLFTFAYTRFKGTFGEGTGELKKSFKKKEKKKRTRKTWARIKQDFQDYYQDLKDEFEKGETEYLEEGIEKKNDQMRIRPPRGLEMSS